MIQADTIDDIYTPGAPKKLRRYCRFKQVCIFMKYCQVREDLPSLFVSGATLMLAEPMVMQMMLRYI